MSRNLTKTAPFIVRLFLDQPKNFRFKKIADQTSSFRMRQAIFQEIFLIFIIKRKVIGRLSSKVKGTSYYATEDKLVKGKAKQKALSYYQSKNHLLMKVKRRKPLVSSHISTLSQHPRKVKRRKPLVSSHVSSILEVFNEY